MKNKVKVVIIAVVLVVFCAVVAIMAIGMTKRIVFAENEGDLNNSEIHALVEPEKWDTSKVTIYRDPASGKVAPIPKGYSVSQVEGETGIDTGLVIYEGETAVTGTVADATNTSSSAWEASKTRNQWVWVPCEDVSRIYEEDSTTGKKRGKLYSYSSTGRSGASSSYYEPRALTDNDYDNEKYFGQYNMIGKTKERMQKELERKYEATIESIKKYGGFYIGRYETGNVSEAKPVVRRMNTDIHSISWYGMYDKVEYLGANENVKTNIIWGSLWDETLEWLVDTKATDSKGNIIGYAGMYDSASWGNYSNSNFEYINASGNKVTKSSSTRIPTGSAEYTKANNIYDMAGNVREWTLEADDAYYRVYRGGYYCDNGDLFPASNRLYYYTYYSSDYIRGACVLLHKIEILLCKILFYVIGKFYFDKKE